MVTKELLQLVSYKTPKLDLSKLAATMNDAFSDYGLDSKEQQCAFIAQTAHETGGWRWVEELGNKAYFDKYEPSTSIGKRLGNTKPGDGALFKGRGLIQLTGRSNYMAFGKWLKSNYSRTFDAIEVATDPFLAFMAAIWYWDKNKLKDVSDFKVLTKKINGGYNGLEDRLKRYNTLLKNYKDVAPIRAEPVKADPIAVISTPIKKVDDSKPVEEKKPWWKRLFGG